MQKKMMVCLMMLLSSNAIGSITVIPVTSPTQDAANQVAINRYANPSSPCSDCIRRTVDLGQSSQDHQGNEDRTYFIDKAKENVALCVQGGDGTTELVFDKAIKVAVGEGKAAAAKTLILAQDDAKKGLLHRFFNNHPHITKAGIAVLFVLTIGAVAKK